MSTLEIAICMHLKFSIHFICFIFCFCSLPSIHYSRVTNLDFRNSYLQFVYFVPLDSEINCYLFCGVHAATIYSLFISFLWILKLTATFFVGCIQRLLVLLLILGFFGSENFTWNLPVSFRWSIFVFLCEV